MKCQGCNERIRHPQILSTKTGNKRVCGCCWGLNCDIIQQRIIGPAKTKIVLRWIREHSANFRRAYKSEIDAIAKRVTA